MKKRFASLIILMLMVYCSEKKSHLLDDYLKFKILTTNQATPSAQLVVFDAPTRSSFNYKSEDGNTLCYSQITSQIEAFNIGTLIASDETKILPDGYYAEIMSVDRTKQCLNVKEMPPLGVVFKEVLIDTEINQGKAESINLNLNLKIEEGKGSQVIRFDRTINVTEGIRIDGNIEVISRIKLKLDMDTKLKYMKFLGQLDIINNLKVFVDYKTTEQKDFEVPLAKFTFAKIPIGGTPIGITPVLTLKLKVAANGEIKFAYYIDQTNSFDVGFEYSENDGWKNLSKSEKDFKYGITSLDGKGNLTAMIGPNLDLQIMAKNGAFIYTALFGKAILESQNLDTVYALKVGGKVDIGVKMNLLLLKTGYEASNILFYENEIARGTIISPAKIVSLSEKNITDSSADISVETNKSIEKIKIRYGENGSLTSMKEIGTSSALVSTVPLSVLKPNTLYTYTGTVIVAGGKETTSEIKSFRTKPAKLIKIDLNCPESINESGSVVCDPKATYSDGTVVQINVAMSSSDPIITVSGKTLSAGAVDNDRFVNITGTFENESGVATVNVKNVSIAKTLSSTSVNCPTSLVEGNSGNCITTATYSDGSTDNTVNASLSSSKSAVLSVSGNTITANQVTASESVTITSIFDGKTATANVQVYDSAVHPPVKVLTGIVLTVPTSIDEGKSGVSSVVKVYSDGSSSDLSNATLSSVSSLVSFNGYTLTVGHVTQDASVYIHASFTESGTTYTDDKRVGIRNIVALIELLSGTSITLYDLGDPQIQSLLIKTTTDSNTYIEHTITKTDGISGVKTGGTLVIKDDFGSEMYRQYWATSSKPTVKFLKSQLNKGKTKFYFYWYSDEGSTHSTTEFLEFNVN